jgi:hypothetical protein
MISSKSGIRHSVVRPGWQSRAVGQGDPPFLAEYRIGRLAQGANERLDVPHLADISGLLEEQARRAIFDQPVMLAKLVGEDRLAPRLDQVGEGLE